MIIIFIIIIVIFCYYYYKGRVYLKNLTKSPFINGPP